MINDFWQIKNEGDRELYVKIRNLIDDWFEEAIKAHKTKDHKAHECFNKEMDINTKKLNSVLKIKSTVQQIVILDELIEDIADNLVIAIQEALIVFEAIEKLEELRPKS
jgi:hypothetical protein